MLIFILLVLLAIANYKIFYLRTTIGRLYEITLDQHYENLKRDPLCGDFSALSSEQKIELFKLACELFKGEVFELFWRSCNNVENSDKTFLEFVSRIHLDQMRELSIYLQACKSKKCSIKAEKVK